MSTTYGTTFTLWCTCAPRIAPSTPGPSRTCRRSWILATSNGFLASRSVGRRARTSGRDAPRPLTPARGRAHPRLRRAGPQALSVNPEDVETEQMDVKRLRAEVSDTHGLVKELRTQVLELRAEANERLRRSVRENYRRQRVLSTAAAAIGPSGMTVVKGERDMPPLVV